MSRRTPTYERNRSKSRHVLAGFAVGLACLMGGAPRAEAGLLTWCGRALGTIVLAADWTKACLGMCNTGRGAPDYFADFGSLLVDSLEVLGPNDLVIDLGCGKGFFGREMFLGEPWDEMRYAEIQDGQTAVGPPGNEVLAANYRKVRLIESDRKRAMAFANRPASMKPHFVGLAMSVPKKLPPSSKVEFIAANFDRDGDAVHGRLNQLGSAKVIIDEYGVLSYTLRPGATLQKVFDRLEIGGSYFANFSNLRVLYRGQFMTLDTFLSLVPGLEVRRTSPVLEEAGARNAVRMTGGLQVIKRGEVKMPGLHVGPGIPGYEGNSARLLLGED